jgi:hypothetical protein
LFDHVNKRGLAGIAQEEFKLSFFVFCVEAEPETVIPGFGSRKVRYFGMFPGMAVFLPKFRGKLILVVHGHHSVPFHVENQGPSIAEYVEYILIAESPVPGHGKVEDLLHRYGLLKVHHIDKQHSCIKIVPVIIKSKGTGMIAAPVTGKKIVPAGGQEISSEFSSIQFRYVGGTDHIAIQIYHFFIIKEVGNKEPEVGFHRKKVRVEPVPLNIWDHINKVQRKDGALLHVILEECFIFRGNSAVKYEEPVPGRLVRIVHDRLDKRGHVRNKIIIGGKNNGNKQIIGKPH